MKIALWLEKDTWAFGRIANALKKYSRHDIDIYGWSTETRDWSQYDLLYTPTWFAQQYFRRHFADKIPVCCGVHGVAELFNCRTDNLEHRDITAKQVESGRISNELRAILNSQRIIGCVSRELVNLLRPQVDCALAYTPCGVDVDHFTAPIQQMPLTVLCPATKDQLTATQHGYDVKRWGLVKEIASQLPDVEFRFLGARHPLDKMPNYYRTGNVILCLSHSEGGPLGILEAGVSGVIPLSTPVGVVPEIIIPGYNGELLINVVEDAVHTLSKWKDSNLAVMQERVRATMMKRSWKNLIESWDTFFDLSV